MAEPNPVVGHVDQPVSSFDQKIERPKPVPPTEQASVVDESAKASPATVPVWERTSWQASSEVDEVIKSLAGQNSRVSIRLDAQTNRVIVEVVDAKSGAVIRKVPPEDLGHMFKKLEELNGPSLDLLA